MPYYLVYKIIFTENIIQQQFYIMSYMPINMNINTPLFRKQLTHQYKTWI